MSERLHVILDEHGLSLGKRSERLVVRRRKDTLREVPFHDVEQITLAGNGISISTDVLYQCVQHDVQVNMLLPTGQPYAKIISPIMLGTVQTRRQQLLAYYDQRGVSLATAFAAGKIRNQINLLKYFAKYRRKARPDTFARIMAAVSEMEAILARADEHTGSNVDEVRPRLMAMEGQAARHYWEMVGELLPKSLSFTGRVQRGATDPVNSMLNYGYGILYNECWGALLNAGLEPFAGFLHVDRPGKPSLVLDFVEEFRQPTVDRPIFSALNRNYRPSMKDGQLAATARREVAQIVLDRLETQVRYGGKKYRLRIIIQMQARAIAAFLREER